MPNKLVFLCRQMATQRSDSLPSVICFYRIFHPNNKISERVCPANYGYQFVFVAQISFLCGFKIMGSEQNCLLFSKQSCFNITTNQLWLASQPIRTSLWTSINFNSCFNLSIGSLCLLKGEIINSVK